MTVVAFVGLGTMGAPMARNLLASGFDVVGVNRSSARTEAFVADGGRAAATVAEAVRGADVIALMLPDSPDVRSVMEGEGGVLTHASPGTLVIDFSSIRPDVTAELAAKAAAADLRMIDAPVSGGEVGAIEASLSIMVGGSQDDFEAAGPVLSAVGQTFRLVGPASAGQIVKAANQLIVAGAIQLLAEAIVLLEAYDVDLTAALDVLGGGLAGSTVLQRKRQTMLARDFRPGFRIELHHKDMGIAVAAARAAGVDVP